MKKLMNFEFKVQIDKHRILSFYSRMVRIMNIILELIKRFKRNQI